ncbi:MAG: hypothetical protein ACYC2H_05720 [Thermoplasmatota archaeon]
MGFLKKAFLAVLMLAIGIVPAVALWMEVPANGGAADAAGHDAPRDTSPALDPIPPIEKPDDASDAVTPGEFDWVLDAQRWADEEAERLEEAQRLAEERLQEAERQTQERFEERERRREERQQEREDRGFSISIGGGGGEGDEED